MKLNKNLISAVMVVLFLLNAGCSTLKNKPEITYSPDELRYASKPGLSLIAINTANKNLSIDNVKISTKLVFIRPGPHELFGQLNLVTQEWINHAAYMKKQGYTFDERQYAYIKGKEVARPDGINRFGYYKQNLTFRCVAGKIYNITDFAQY